MQGEFKKCKACGKIFRLAGQPFCPDCIKKMDDDFKKIKEYLYESPNATIAEVVEETGVEEATVFFMLKEGRLEMRSASGFLTCRHCGAPISSGTICDRCAEKLSSAFESVLEKNRPVKKDSIEDSMKKGRMYTDGRRKQF